MKNIETPDKMHLSKLIDELRYGKFVIPDFQREFEWYPWDVAELLKSILEDYYIGTLLLWRASKENLELLDCESIYGFKNGEERPEHIVLDGQQRLSALYYSFFSPNKHYPKRKTRCLFFLKLDELLNDNYSDTIYYEWETKSVAKLMENRDLQYENKVLPMKIFGEKPRELVKWMEGYEKFWAKIIDPKKAEGERNELEDKLNDYLDNYDVSYIELDRNIEVSKVCDIFTRINNTGIDLTIFDLLNALLRPKNIKLKDLWRKISDTEELGVVDSEKMRVYLLQVISIIKQGYCSPKYLYYLVPKTPKTVKKKNGKKKKEILIDDKKEFLDNWKLSVKLVKQGVKILQNPRDYGAVNPRFIPYPTMIPIFSAINWERNKDDYQNKKENEKKIKQWYWASIFTKNYSSAVESQMQKDWTDLKRWFIEDSYIPKVIKQAENDVNNISLKYETYQNSAIYKAIFNILVINEARDWETFNLPEYSELQDHHIVPKSWGKKLNIKKINSILNRTPLSDNTNQNVISDQMPNDYLKMMIKKLGDKESLYNLMKTHLISRKAVDILMRNNFDEKDFEEFIEEREKSIINEIKRLLYMDVKAQDGLFEPGKPYSNKILFKKLILGSYKYIYWIDKYFSIKGLEVLAEAILDSQKDDLENIKILTSLDKINLKTRNVFKDLREELKNQEINAEMKVMVDTKLKASIHDRWFITDGKIFNIPSTDTMVIGQYSEIKETINRPPFEKWWGQSKDVVYDWNEINSLLSKSMEKVILYCQGKGAKAKGIFFEDGRMLVKKGSSAVIGNTPAFLKLKYKKIKDRLIKELVLEKKGNNLIFTRDYEFSSPSAAVAVILGRSASGPEEWKDENGKLLKQIA